MSANAAAPSRRRTRPSWLTVLFVIPLLLAGLYYLVLAQERYVSTTVMTVRRANQDSLAAGGLAMLMGGSGGSHEDAYYLREYIHSLALMNKLDAQFKLREHFASTRTDPFFRLWPSASQEWMLEYWRARVDVSLDEVSGLLQLRVEGFDPVFAQRINQAILAESDAFVNTISQKIAREQMAFAQGELEQAKVKLDTVSVALLKFQGDKQVLDPGAEAQASGLLTSEMRAQLAKFEAELTVKRAYLNEDAPDVSLLKTQIAALRQQVSRETRGATRADAGSLNRLALEFHELKARAKFAEDAYKGALAAVENARIEAGRKVKSLVVIEPPTLAERAEYPRRIYSLLTALVLVGLLFALTRLTLATIHEHRD